MERLFDEDLRQKAANLGFQVGAVECHTKTCVGELIWKSLGQARAEFKATLGKPDRTKCEPRLLLSQEGNEDAPEMGVMLLSCEHQREHAAREAGLGKEH